MYDYFGPEFVNYIDYEEEDPAIEEDDDWLDEIEEEDDGQGDSDASS